MKSQSSMLPGGYLIKGCVLGSFHQGHEPFGVTVRIHCTCVSLPHYAGQL